MIDNAVLNLLFEDSMNPQSFNENDRKKMTGEIQDEENIKKTSIEMDTWKQKLNDGDSPDCIVLSYDAEDIKKDDEISGKIVDFFSEHPEPSDDEVHDFAERLGISPDELEEHIYSILGEELQKQNFEIDTWKRTLNENDTNINKDKEIVYNKIMEMALASLKALHKQLKKEKLQMVVGKRGEKLKVLNSQKDIKEKVKRELLKQNTPLNLIETPAHKRDAAKTGERYIEYSVNKGKNTGQVPNYKMNAAWAGGRFINMQKGIHPILKKITKIEELDDNRIVAFRKNAREALADVYDKMDNILQSEDGGSEEDRETVKDNITKLTNLVNKLNKECASRGIHKSLDDLNEFVSGRRFGNPRTEEERKRRHLQRFGTEELPERGTGLINKDNDINNDILKKIVRVGNKWELRSKSTGKLLGRHDTREEAVAQERVIQMHKEENNDE